MGIMNKMKDFIGLNDDVDEYEEEFDEQEEYESKPRQNKINTYSKKDNIINFHSNSDMKLFICDPTKYEDCTKAVDELKNRKAVVLNIENLELEDQKQIFEFIKGAVYALEASIQKVSKGIFVIAPVNVQIDGKMNGKSKHDKNYSF